MIRVSCNCGKSFDVDDSHAGKTGKCKGCGAKFVIPSVPSLEPIVQQEPEASYATTVFVGKPIKTGRRWFERLAVAIVAILIGAGIGYAVWGKPISPLVSTLKPVVQNEDKRTELLESGLDLEGQIKIDRLLNPFRIASLYWNDSEEKLRNLSVEVSTRLQKRNVDINISTIALILYECGKAEQTWRGNERCEGASLCLILLNQMIDDKTPLEEIIRIMIVYYGTRVKGGECDAKEAWDIRMRTHKGLQGGAFKTATQAYQQLLIANGSP